MNLLDPDILRILEEIDDECFSMLVSQNTKYSLEEKDGYLEFSMSLSRNLDYSISTVGTTYEDFKVILDYVLSIEGRVDRELSMVEKTDSLLPQSSMIEVFPRDLDHGWWNCSSCRERLHTANFPLVEREEFHDQHGNYFTLEYIQDMLEWLVGSERFIQAATVRDFIKKWKESVKEGIDIPKSKVY